MTADARRIIDRAADLLEQQGWCQVRLVAFDGPKVCRCASQAMYDAGMPESGTAYMEACSAVNKAAYQLGFRNIAYYNDAPGRTQAEVVAVLRAVAGGEES